MVVRSVVNHLGNVLRHEKLRSVVRAAADFVYPNACRLCDADVSRPSVSAAAPIFCKECDEALRGTHGPACLSCGATIGPYLDAKARCLYCRDERFAFDRVFRLGVYEGVLRAACLRAKERSAEPLAEGLAELVWEYESSGLREQQIDVVVWVPAHWTRRLWRPHTAAETVARYWARRLQVPLGGSILKKTRRTLPQARLTPSERRVNLKKAFAIRERDAFAGATVLLADDVMTTGTTAHEVSRVLRQAGAARVFVAVLARGLGRR